MLARMRCPSQSTSLMYTMWLVSCSFLLSRTFKKVCPSQEIVFSFDPTRPFFVYFAKKSRKKVSLNKFLFETKGEVYFLLTGVRKNKKKEKRVNLEPRQYRHPVHFATSAWCNRHYRVCTSSKALTTVLQRVVRGAGMKLHRATRCFITTRWGGSSLIVGIVVSYSKRSFVSFRNQCWFEISFRSVADAEFNIITVCVVTIGCY